MTLEEKIASYIVTHTGDINFGNVLEPCFDWNKVSDGHQNWYKDIVAKELIAMVRENDHLIALLHWSKQV